MTEPWQTVRASADARVPAVGRAVRRALQQLQRRLTEDQLARLALLLDVGAIEILSGVQRLPADLQPALVILRGAVVEGARAEGIVLARHLRTGAARFDLRNPFVDATASDQAARLGAAILNETRLAIRVVVQQAFVAELPPRQTARLIRPLLGLTRRDALAVINRRFALLEAGWPVARIQADAERYAARLLRRRAMNIARTETLFASSAGQQALWERALRDGFLPPGFAQRWIVTPDDRLCPICAPMHNQVRALGELFVSPFNGQTARHPPMHPSCRCAIIAVVPAVARRRVA